jgi:hypothetical protein
MRPGIRLLEGKLIEQIVSEVRVPHERQSPVREWGIQTLRVKLDRRPAPPHAMLNGLHLAPRCHHALGQGADAVPVGHHTVGPGSRNDSS